MDPHAGKWRGLHVAIKTIVFTAPDSKAEGALVASEAAIASSLVHDNIVATYSHDLQMVAVGATSYGSELPVFKFFLIQARPAPPRTRHALVNRSGD